MKHHMRHSSHHTEKSPHIAKLMGGSSHGHKQTAADHLMRAHHYSGGISNTPPVYTAAPAGGEAYKHGGRTHCSHRQHHAAGGAGKVRKGVM